MISATSMLFFIMLIRSYGQEIEGVVIDKNTKQRVGQVCVYNTANDEIRYNDSKGEFAIKASVGDTLIAIVKEYQPDTLIVNNPHAVVFRIYRSSIWIQEVTVVAKRNPDDIYRMQKEAYGSEYKQTNVDPISIGPGGVGISVDAIYSLLSRRGRNARHLQQLLYNQYEENMVDAKFRPDLVARVTGLNDKALRDFMLQYRPTFYFVQSASEYELIEYVQSNYKLYQKNTGARRLVPLPKLKIKDLDEEGFPAKTE